MLTFTALFSIVNPLSGAFIFSGATRDLEPKDRSATARWVAIYSFAIVAASLYVGAYVLEFFGVSKTKDGARAGPERVLACRRAERPLARC